MKILLACDGEYRLYLEAIANAIRAFRPYVDVALIDMEELETKVESLHPQLVIVSGASIPPNPVDLHLLGHIEAFPESEGPSNFRVGERVWEATKPTLGEILSVVDEVQALYSASSLEQESTDHEDEAEA